MSDEEHDAGVDDRSTELEISGDDLSGVSDPALASRLENIHRSMSTLGMRIDALVTSTTTYRSALTDRLNEYADLVTKLTRAQATDLEEYRRANERTLADLRRGLSTSEETLERVGARIDSMLTDTESSDDSSRRVLAEVRSILEAQENLGRFLTESLDQFGEQVLGRLDATEQRGIEQLEALRSTVSDVDATPDPSISVLGDRLARVEDELSSNGKVATESFGELAGLRAKVDAILETSAKETGAVSTVLEQLKDTLLDVASGEVVGSLWDEVRQVGATVEALVDRDGQTADPEAVEALRVDVAGLTTAVRELLEQAEVVDEDGVGEAEAHHLATLSADVAALRAELAAGVAVDPSDAFGETVEQLRTELTGIGERLTAVAVEPAAAPPEIVVDLPEELEAELRSLRSGVEDIIARLDEGLVLAEDDTAPPAPTETAPELADQVATLRDQVSAEFERVRQLVEAGTDEVDLTPLTARLDRLHDDLADQQPPDAVPATDLAPVLDALGDVQEGIAALLDRPLPEPPAPPPTESPTSDGYATVDPDVIDLLREEIRTAGSTGDELVETLANELKALRRRIRLRAEGEIFSDEQLELIADAVARKLAD